MSSGPIPRLEGRRSRLTASGSTPPPAPAIVVGRAIDRADVESLCAAACRLAAAHANGPLDVDVEALAQSDLGVVDGLARIALEARRVGRSVRIVGATPELRELLALSGLTRAMPCAPESSVETRR
jgi:hypothetical protein